MTTTCHGYGFGAELAPDLTRMYLPKLYRIPVWVNGWQVDDGMGMGMGMDGMGMGFIRKTHHYLKHLFAMSVTGIN